MNRGPCREGGPGDCVDSSLQAQLVVESAGNHESLRQGADPVAVEIGEAHYGVSTFGDPAVDRPGRKGDSGEFLGPEVLGLGGPKSFLPEGGPREGPGQGIVPGNQDLSRPPEGGEKSADDEDTNQGLEDVTDGDPEDLLLVSVRVGMGGVVGLEDDF